MDFNCKHIWDFCGVKVELNYVSDTICVISQRIRRLFPNNIWTCVVALIRVWTMLNFKISSLKEHLNDEKFVQEKTKNWRRIAIICNCSALHCFGEKRFGENGGGDIGLVRGSSRWWVLCTKHTALHQMNDPLPFSFLLLLTSAPNGAPLFFSRWIVSYLSFFGACAFSPPWCKCKLQAIVWWLLTPFLPM